MTELEARRLLDEHRAFPRFVRGRGWYVVLKSGQVDVYRLSKSGKRAVFERTVDPDSYCLPIDVRERLAGK